MSNCSNWNTTIISKMSQKFSNILILASLYIYHKTEAVQAMESTYCGW